MKENVFNSLDSLILANLAWVLHPDDNVNIELLTIFKMLVDFKITVTKPKEL